MRSPARNKRNEPTALVNHSCASGIVFESILRPIDLQNGFHTAKTQLGHKLSGKAPILRMAADGCAALMSAPLS
jgi:hypothetical protein